MKITQEELTALIKASDGGHQVLCSFGPSGVRLDINNPGNLWALRLLAEMRMPVCI